jgi:hypothetical protein
MTDDERSLDKDSLKNETLKKALEEKAAGIHYTKHFIKTREKLREFLILAHAKCDSYLHHQISQAKRRLDEGVIEENEDIAVYKAIVAEQDAAKDILDGLSYMLDLLPRRRDLEANPDD